MKTIVLLFFWVACGAVYAQEMIVFPAKGQNEQQMEKDKYDCYSWAKKQTKYDPMQPAPATKPPPANDPPKGGVGRGAAKGAAIGAAVGSFDGDMGDGAKKGAAAGAIVGGLRRRGQKRHEAQAEQEWAAEQTAASSRMIDEYNRAYGACLEGKGYSVK